MQDKDFYILGRRLLNQYNLNDWVIIIENGHLGMCYHTIKKITMTHKMLLQSDAEITNLLLHEIAHALTWVRYGIRGHNGVFYTICREIGCTPTRNQMITVTHKYAIFCNGCKKIIQKGDRLTSMKNRYCKTCGNDNLYWLPYLMH